jgi:hypothetical protein
LGLKGEPTRAGSTSPRYGEKASDYSAVGLETGAVQAMELAGNSCAESSVAFLRQLRANYAEHLIVFWDDGPAHDRVGPRRLLSELTAREANAKSSPKLAMNGVSQAPAFWLS